jgi:hypothetical protein
MADAPDDAPDDQAPVIQIELRLDGSMPAGIATGPGSPARHFTGWTGLMAAVDSLTEGRATAADRPELGNRPGGISC